MAFEAEAKLNVAGKGAIIVKQHSNGIGFELIYPKPDSDEERRWMKKQFQELIPDVESIVDELIDLFEKKAGYKPSKKGKTLPDWTEE